MHVWLVYRMSLSVPVVDPILTLVLCWYLAVICLVCSSDVGVNSQVANMDRDGVLAFMHVGLPVCWV